MDENDILTARASEQLIWNRLLQNPQDKSCTLSYRFLINKTMNPEQINEAIYRFLSKHRELNYRFYEHEGILYKRYHQPSLTSAIQIEGQLPHTKMLFTEPLTPLYSVQWQLLNEGFCLYLHLSHLIIDGSGFELLVSELEAAFLDKQIFDHAVPVHEVQENDSYWQHYLKEQSLHQTIPFLEQVESTELVHHERLIRSEVTQQLIAYTKKHKATLFQLLSTALAITLHHYLKDESAETTIRLAYYVKLNKHCNTFGCDINLLPLFVPCSDTHSLSQVLQSIVDTRRGQREVQNIPIVHLLKYVDPIKNNNLSLLNVVINESPGLLASANSDFFPEVAGIDNHSAANTLSLIYTFDGEKLRIRFESNQGRLLQLLLGQLAHHFEKTLELLVTKPHLKLGDLVFRETMDPVCRGDIFSYEKNALWNTFLGQMNQHQSRTAIVDGKNTLSYKDLYLCLSAVYRNVSLIDKSQLTKGIALFITRSSMLPVAILSAIATKVTFIPIAENIPDSARLSMINETGLKIIFVDNHTEQLLSAQEKETLHVINLELITTGTHPVSQIPLEPLIQNDLAYILFTSGSTGKPKGVMITYENLTHFLYSVSSTPGFTQHDTLLALTSISFDISINELLLPLFCGGCVSIASNEVRSCHQSLGTLINQENISILQATPSTLHLLMQSQWVWHNKRKLRLWVGGETLTAELVQFFKRQNIDIYNMYGPTETTIWVSASLIHSPKLLSIGTPLANTSLYVLDNMGEAMPLGIPGELVIEGQLVGNGYINYPSTSFKEAANGLRRYHTGDKVVALAKNTLIYIKRYDEQIKLRGHRIELEEINTHIRALIPHFIGLTLIVTQPEPHLCVYYTSPTDLNVDRLGAQLKKILPEYKLPQRYHLLKTMPLNNSGKVDKKRLVEYKLDELPSPQDKGEFTQPMATAANAIEQKIIQLISHHFNITITNLELSLLDYGFNSLSFNQLSSLCDKELGFAINSHQFYHLNTIKKLAEYYSFNKRIPIKTNPLVVPLPIHADIPIAIIGYDALLPGDKNPTQFWHSLLNQESLITTNQRPWLNSNERAGYINDIEYFDRKFFNLSPIEVMHLDFRQRLLLQCAFRTMEHATTPPTQLDQKQVGCFIAATGLDSLLASTKQEIPAHPYTLSGNSLSMLANRLSFYFNWQGPSITVDTACSGSLAALARAVECLTLGRADLCFVGSANLIIDNELTRALQAGRFLSPQNHCASFLDEADGYVRGEGIFGFLLKPLEQAKRDGDVIHAVIHHVIENHGGRAASLTSPSQQAQTALLKAAYPKQLAHQLSYIETHGTGTKLGDPIEIDALKDFENLSLAENQQQTIYLGALKQNIGHLEASAGFASLLKVILAMKYKLLPANVRSQSLNPLINLENSKLELITNTLPWNNKILTAGVSSFGFGGSNAHAVLSHFEQEKQIHSASEFILPVILSAKTMTSLRARIKNLLNDLHEDSSFIDIAHSLAVGRTHFECRTAVLAKNKQQLYQRLNDLLETDNLVNPIEHHPSFSPLLDKYLSGNNIDWQNVFEPFDGKRITLTPYVFDSEPCLHEVFQRLSVKTINLMDDISWITVNAHQQKIILRKDHPFLTQHQVFKYKVLPGVAYIDFLLMELTRQNLKQTAFCLENICWLQPAVCEDDSLALLLETNMKPGSVPGSMLFQFSNSDGQVLATGEYTQFNNDHALLYPWFNNAKNELKQAGLNKVLADDIYKKFSRLGIDYGFYFQGISSVTLYKNLALSLITINPQGSCIGLLDASFQSGMAINLSETQAGLMPFSLGKIIIFDSSKLRTMQRSWVYTFKNSPFRTNFIICDEQEQPIVALVDLGVKPSQLNIMSSG